jgi:hypothetical protein
MAAAAYLAKLGADRKRLAFGKEHKWSRQAQAAQPPLPPTSSPLQELRNLLARLLLRARDHPAFVWAWSRWRCRHQAMAAISHRKSRSTCNCRIKRLPLVV